MLTNVITIKTKENLKLSNFKRGFVHKVYIQISGNALGDFWKVPIIIIRGEKKGKTLGVTAAIHGDELNGISTIFKLVKKINPKKLSGNLILVPISNVPAYLSNQRYFFDGVDLNRIMPGEKSGTPSEIYANTFIQKIFSKFDILLDLHTASYGRVNSLFLYADLENENCKQLAYLQNPQIIVNKSDAKGTLRYWANQNNVPAVTIEIGNSNTFQHNLIDETLEGIVNTLKYYKMYAGKHKDMINDTTICDSSYWIRASRGGIIDVLPKLAEKVKKNQTIAYVYNVFGDVVETIKTDRSGIVIGKNVSPNCDAGIRVLHLGIARKT